MHYVDIKGNNHQAKPDHYRHWRLRRNAMIADTAKKIALALRLHARLSRVRWNRRQQLSVLLRAGTASGDACPICESRCVAEVSFDRPEGRIVKSFCRSCQHLFTEFLQTDPNVGNAIFRFANENAGMATQVKLLAELAERSGKARGTYLDFGVGANIGAFQEARRSMPSHRFMGCDVYDSGISGYFRTYDPTAPLGKFDGVSSYAVIEHLTETLKSWCLLNRLLKPMAEGGGIMVHAFPSQLHHDFEHWAIQITTHVCVFSRKSLRRTCRASGFELVKADPPRPVGPHDHPIMVFRKFKDV